MTSWIAVPPTREDLENRIDELETLLREAAVLIGLLRMFDTGEVNEKAYRLLERIGLTVAS